MTRVEDTRHTIELMRRYEGYFQRADTHVEFWPLSQDGEYGYECLTHDATAKVTRIKLGAVKPRMILKHAVFVLEVCGAQMVEIPLLELDSADGFVLAEPIYIAARMSIRPGVRFKDAPTGGMVELFLCGETTVDVL